MLGLQFGLSSGNGALGKGGEEGQGWGWVGGA